MFLRCMLCNVNGRYSPLCLINMMMINPLIGH